MSCSRRLDVLLLTGLLLATAVEAEPAVPSFVEVTAAAGISAAHHAIFMGVGQAWGDADRDGCVDLYLTDQAGSNSLWRNNCDGTFEPSPHTGDVALPGSESMGAAFADYDNDGWLDLYVTARGAGSLFHNEAGAGFTDVTATAGVGIAGQFPTAAWGDYDGDGRLDLFLVNYSEVNTDRLFHNAGDGTFTDVSSALAGEVRVGWTAVFVDYDNDGDADLYVINDRQLGNQLYRNDGAGCGHWCFAEVGAASGADRPVYGMGIAVGDYDTDGDLDFYFSSIAEMVLLQNQTSQGSPTFVDVSEAAGVTVDSIGWGTLFFDCDNDGLQDLYLATMLPDPGKTNRLYANLGDGTFADLSEASGAADPGPTLGVASADYDADGRVDLVIGNLDDAYYLYRNQTAGGGWLRMTFEGRGPVNRDALGTRVYLTAGGRTQLQELHSGSSLGAGNEIALHFGLGAAAVEEVKVVWPDGLTEVYPAPLAAPRWHLIYPAIFADGFESGDLSAWSDGF